MILLLMITEVEIRPKLESPILVLNFPHPLYSNVWNQANPPLNKIWFNILELFEIQLLPYKRGQTKFSAIYTSEVFWLITYTNAVS